MVMSEILSRRAIVPVLVVLLTACSSKAPPPVTVDVAPLWQQHLAQLETVTTWSFHGRVAVRQGKEAWNVKLDWSQSRDRYDLLLTAPWGQGAVRLYGETGRAVLEAPDRAPRVAEDPQTLLARQVGWQVPVTQLRYWMLGRPEPDQGAVIEWDGRGRIRHMNQAGWSIDYRRYGDVRGVSLPRKIELKNEALRLRLVIDKWRLNEDE